MRLKGRPPSPTITTEKTSLASDLFQSEESNRKVALNQK